jgi:hypothetical protein
MQIKRISAGLDFSAAIWASFLAGAIFLMSLMLITGNWVGDSDFIWRMIAAIVQGEEALNPAVAVSGGTMTAALLIHFALSLFWGLIITLVIHRWGLLVGLAGGALLGFFIYGINFFSMSFFFPWFYPLRSSAWLIGHLIFGAIAGGIYELLEVDDYERDQLERKS